MFRSKLLNFFILGCLFYYFQDFNEIENSSSYIKTDVEKQGAILKTKNEKIYVEFLSNTETPNKETLWTIQNNESQTILSWVNKEGVKFTQTWNFEDHNQPILEIFVEHDGKILNILTEIIIENENKESKIAHYINKLKEVDNSNFKLFSFEKQDGWAGFSNKLDVCIAKINNEKCEIREGKIKIFKESRNKDLTCEKIYFNISSKQFFLLKKQTIFKNLEDLINFGFFSRITKPFYILFKNIHNHSKNLPSSIMILFLLFYFLLLPFIIKAIENNGKYRYMQSEIEAIPSKSFEQTQSLKKEIYDRYEFNPFHIFLLQMMLLASFSILNGIFENIEFLELTKYLERFFYLILAILIIMQITYHKIFTKENDVTIQYLTSVMSSVIFMAWNKIAIINLIGLYFLIILQSLMNTYNDK